VAVAVLLLAGCTTHSTLPPGINSQIEPSSPPHVTLRISADVTSQTVDGSLEYYCAVTVTNPNAKMVPAPLAGDNCGNLGAQPLVLRATARLPAMHITAVMIGNTAACIAAVAAAFSLYYARVTVRESKAARLDSEAARRDAVAERRELNGTGSAIALNGSVSWWTISALPRRLVKLATG